jgi:vesicle-associated membrane protein 2
VGVSCLDIANLISRLERDAKLGDLEERADALQDGCKQFEQQAAAMKNKFWLENLKAMIAAGVVGVIVCGLLYWKFFMAPPPPPAYPAYPPPPPPPAPAAPAAPAADAGGDAGADAGGDGGGDGGGDDGGSSDFVSLNFARWF